PLRPPALVQPGAPVALSAQGTKDGVRLTWRKPTSYTGGGRMEDLAGFYIERATTETNFARIGELVLNEQQRYRRERTVEWTDGPAERGVRYRYRVIAFTLDGYKSAPSGQVTIERGAPQASAQSGSEVDPSKTEK